MRSAPRILLPVACLLAFIHLLGSARGATTYDLVPEVVTPARGTGVEAYWAAHPYNPANSGGEILINSPGRDANGNTVNPIVPGAVVNLASGGNIATAAAGGNKTIILAPGGTYAGFDLVGINNVHIICTDPNNRPTITGQFRLAVSTRALDYALFDSDLDGDVAAAWTEYRNPSKNFYFKNVKFDSTALQNEIKRVWHVLFDNCSFKTRYPTTAEKHHRGSVLAHMGNTNVSFLNCQFLGNSEYAFYFDGAHCTTVLNCTFALDSNGTSPTGYNNGPLFLTNDDFTEAKTWDPQNKIDFREELNAKFNVVTGSTFTGTSTKVLAYTGETLLFKNNTHSGSSGMFLSWDSRSGSAKKLSDPDWNYVYQGVVITGNTFGSLAGASPAFLAIYHVGADNSVSTWGAQDAQAYMGGYRIAGNTIASAPAGYSMVSKTIPAASEPFWIGPELVGGNRINGSGTLNADYGLDAPVPAAPTGLTATALGETSIALSWTDNSDEEVVYVVERSSTGIAGPFSEVARTLINRTSFTDSGLTGGTTYSYRVRAANMVGNSNWATVTRSTYPVGSPNAPTGVSAAASSVNSIRIGWTDNSSNETGFKIERSMDGSTGWTVVGTAAANATSYIDAGLPRSTTAHYRVRSTNAVIDSVPIGSASATTLATNPNLITNPSFETYVAALVVPDKWQDRSYLSRDSSVVRTGTYSWKGSATIANGYTFSYSYGPIEPSSEYTLSGYVRTVGATGGGIRVEARVNGAGQITPILVNNAGTWDLVSKTFTTGTTTYAAGDYLRIWVDLSAGNAWVDDLSLVKSDTILTTPTVPATASASAVDDSHVTVAWTDSSANEAGFRIERSLTGTGDWVAVGLVAAGATSWTDSGLSGQTAYYYRVSSYNSGGFSASTAAASATTPGSTDPGHKFQLLGVRLVREQDYPQATSEFTGHHLQFFIKNISSTAAQVSSLAVNGTDFDSLPNETANFGGVASTRWWTAWPQTCAAGDVAVVTMRLVNGDVLGAPGSNITLGLNYADSTSQELVGAPSTSDLWIPFVNVSEDRKVLTVYVGNRGSSALALPAGGGITVNGASVVGTLPSASLPPGAVVPVTVSQSTAYAEGRQLAIGVTAAGGQTAWGAIRALPTFFGHTMWYEVPNYDATDRDAHFLNMSLNGRAVVQDEPFGSNKAPQTLADQVLGSWTSNPARIASIQLTALDELRIYGPTADVLMTHHQWDHRDLEIARFLTWPHPVWYLPQNAWGRKETTSPTVKESYYRLEDLQREAMEGLIQGAKNIQWFSMMNLWWQNSTIQGGMDLVRNRPVVYFPGTLGNPLAWDRVGRIAGWQSAMQSWLANAIPHSRATLAQNVEVATFVTPSANKAAVLLLDKATDVTGFYKASVSSPTAPQQNFSSLAVTASVPEWLTADKAYVVDPFAGVSELPLVRASSTTVTFTLPQFSVGAAVVLGTASDLATLQSAWSAKQVAFDKYGDAASADLAVPAENVLLPEWNYSFPQSEFVWSLDTLPDGSRSLMARGQSLMVFDAAGNVLWQKTYPGEAMAAKFSRNGDRVYVAANLTAGEGQNWTNVQIIAYDSTGNQLWSYAVGGTVFDLETGYADNSVAYGTLGKFQKLTASGSLAWTRNTTNEAHELAATTDGTTWFIDRDYAGAVTLAGANARTSWREPSTSPYEAPQCMAVTPDGSRVALGATKLYLYNAAGAAVGSPIYVGRGLRKLCFSTDGLMLAAGTSDGVLRVYSRDGAFLWEDADKSSYVTDIAALPGGAGFAVMREKFAYTVANLWKNRDVVDVFNASGTRTARIQGPWRDQPSMGRLALAPSANALYTLTSGSLRRVDLAATPAANTSVFDGSLESSLPVGWQTLVTGTDTPPGSVAYYDFNSSFVVSGSGAGWETRPSQAQTAFVETGANNFTFTARLASFSGTLPYSGGGIFVADSADPEGLAAAVFYQPRQNLNRAYYRTSPATNYSSFFGTSGVLDKWMRVIRSGNQFQLLTSADGVTWRSLGTATMAMTNPVRVGLLVNPDSANASATGTFDNVSLVVTDAPAAPANVSASMLSDTAVALNWTDSSTTETGFRIEMAASPLGPWEVVATAPANATAYNVTGLDPSHTYYFRVSAVGANGSSAAVAASARTDAPRINLATNGSFEIDANSDGWADGWSSAVSLQRASDRRRLGEFSLKATGNASTASTAFTQSLLANTRYRLIGYIQTSGVADGGGIQLRFAESRPGGPSSAGTIDRNESSTDWKKVVLDFQTSAGFDGAAEVRVDAGLAGGGTAWADDLNLLRLTVPSIPDAPSATALDDSRIQISWTDTSEMESSFEIERSQDGSTWTYVGTAARDTTSFTDASLPAAALRYYRVRAANALGNSSYSGTVAARTLHTDQATNGGMETDANTDGVPDGWTLPRMTWDSSVARSGARSLKGVFGTLQRPETVALPAPATLEAGVTYIAQIWFRMAGVTSGSGVRMLFDELDGAGNTRSLITTGAYTLDNSGVWTPLTFEFTTRADHIRGALRLQIDLGAGSVWLDDFILRKKTVELPSAPTGLTATATAYNSIALAWVDGSFDETLFRIERALSASGPWTEIATVGANATTYTDTSAAHATAYFYRVRAFNGAGTSAYTESATATTPDIAPSGLGGIAVSGSGIQLTWSDNSPDETGFVIQRSEDGLAWAQVGTAAAGATTYTDGTAILGASYYYRVAAVRPGGNTNWSNVATASMGADHLTQSFLSGGWNLSNRRITFHPYNNSYRGFSEPASSLGTDPAGGTSLTLSDDAFSLVTLTGGKTVPFFGTAYGSFYVGSNGFITFTSGDATFNPTLANHFSAKRISALFKDLLGTSNGGAVSWKQTADRVAVTYNPIKSFSGGGSTTMQVEIFFNGVIRLTYLSADGSGAIVGLSNGGGTPSGFTSPGTNLASYPAPSYTVPTAPGTPSLTALTSSSVRVDWADNSNDEWGFRIERSPDGSSSWTAIQTVGENVTSHTDTGLTHLTSYYYRVVAYNANGDSTASAAASVTTPALPPPPLGPTGFLAEAASTTLVTFLWTDRDSNEAGYKIERSTDNATWNQVATASADATSAQDATVQKSTTYFYRIRAWNDGGDSPYSDAVSVTTPSTGEFTSPAYAVWRLNEVVGATAADSSGNGRTATIVDGSWVTNDGGHTGLRFNGTSSRMNIGTLSNLPAPDFAVAFWFKPEELKDASLLSKDGPVIPDFAVSMGQFNGNYHLQVAGGTGNYSASRFLFYADNPTLSNLVAGQWSHVAVVYKRSDKTIYTYKDGVLMPTLALNDPLSWDNTLAVCLGMQSYAGTKAFKGVIDDVRIYQRALTADEVLEVRDSYLALPPGSPVISSQPASTSAVVGGTASFSVTASGTPEPTYQWRKNGVEIPGATSSTLELSNVQTSDAGNYTVVATNSGGSALSTTAVLTVLVPPTITSHPSSATASVGGSVTFSVAASGSATLNYQWKKDGVDVPGGISSSLTISNLQLAHAGNYTVTVTNGAGSATSNAAALTVLPPPAAPGTPSVTALSQSTLRVQWADNSSDETGFKLERSADGVSGWSLVATLAANATSYDDSGRTESTTYYYRVTSTRSGTDSAPSGAGSGTTLAETTPPTVVSAASVSSAQVLITFSEPVEAVTANTAANYAIVGATVSAAVRQTNTATVLLTVSGLSTGSYTVVVTGVRDLVGNTIAGSNQATFAYSTLPADGMTLWLRADAGVTQSSGKVSAWATQATNSVTVTQATAASQPTYVGSGVNGRPVLRFDGTDDHLAFTNLPVNGLTGMTVFVVAANTANQDPATHANASAIYWDETASWGTLYVSPYQTKVKYRFGTGQVNNLPTYTRTNSIGSDFSITAAVHSGTTEALYVNGTQVHTGTGKTATIANCKDSGFLGRGYNSTYYTGDIAEIVVYNRALTTQEIQSVQSYLNTKYFQKAPAITSQPASATVAPGGSATFSVTATGTPAPSYQWRKNGADVPGATSSSLTIANAQAADAGNYSVVVSNAVGSIVSDGAALTVESPLPSAASAPSAAPTSGSGTTSVTLSWTDNSSNETGFRIEVATAAAGPWTSAGTVAANTTSANVVSLAARTTYYFRVIAYNAAGDASPSATVSARTLFPAGAPEDANANGYSDFLEYALGATDSVTLAANLPVPGLDGAADRLALSFKRPSQAPPDADYQLWASDDLVSWTQITNPVTTVSGTGDSSTVTLKDSVPRSSKAKRFLRLAIAHIQ